MEEQQKKNQKFVEQWQAIYKLTSMMALLESEYEKKKDIEREELRKRFVVWRFGMRFRRFLEKKGRTK